VIFGWKLIEALARVTGCILGKKQCIFYFLVLKRTNYMTSFPSDKVLALEDVLLRVEEVQGFISLLTLLHSLI
jgi:hypothetical protein